MLIYLNFATFITVSCIFAHWFAWSFLEFFAILLKVFQRLALVLFAFSQVFKFVLFTSTFFFNYIYFQSKFLSHEK